MNQRFQPYMTREREHDYITETYVCSPPALIVTDEVGAVWTLGLVEGHVPVGGEFEFDVLRNGMATGERANRIERKGGRIAIFGAGGYKRWTGRGFV